MLLYLWMIIQIVCESLPISSSGHVILLQQIMTKYQISGMRVISDLIAFDYMLQGLSALVIFVYFFPQWWQLIVDKPIKIQSLFDHHFWIKTVPQIFLFGFVADGITFLFWNFVDVNGMQIPLFCGFIITGVTLWSLQYTRENKTVAIWSWENGVIVGCVQALSLIAGISRFGTTVTALQWLGYQGRIAFMISFLLQWPLIVAGAIKGFVQLQDQAILQTILTWQFLMIALISGWIAYRILCYVGRCIDRNCLWKFSYYMIIPTFIALYL